MLIFRQTQLIRMPKPARARESALRATWEKLDAQLASGHALIQRKRANLSKLEEERDEATSEEEKKFLATSIKASQLDLDGDLAFFKDLEADNAATKLAIQEELNESDTEPGDEDINTGSKITREFGSSRQETYILREVDKEVEKRMREMEKEVDKEVEKRMREERQEASLTATNSRMDRLITALSEARGPSTSGAEARDREGPGGERRGRTLGQTPTFVTGQSDFITHIESFKDFVDLNDITQEDKVKRLFLTTLDQKARMRCAGLEPNKTPCLEMSAKEYIARLQEQFVPRATLLIVQQAFHDLKQKPAELATDYLLAKWGHFRRGWSRPNAPFSFYYEAATIGLYDEALRNEVFRDVISCPDSNDLAEMNAAFQRYLEKVQQVLAYVRRTTNVTNPDARGLGITGQPTRVPGKPALGNSEVQLVEQMYEDEEEDGWYSAEEGEEVGELDEQQIAFAEALEDPRFTQLVLEDYHSVGEAETKLCFLCKSPNHLARSCSMRMRNLSGAMSKMGFRPRSSQRGWRGGSRGSQRGWRGGSRGAGRGPARGRPAPLSGFPTQLPAPTMRPLTSAQAGYPRRTQDF